MVLAVSLAKCPQFGPASRFRRLPTAALRESLVCYLEVWAERYQNFLERFSENAVFVLEGYQDARLPRLLPSDFMVLIKSLTLSFRQEGMGRAQGGSQAGPPPRGPARAQHFAKTLAKKTVILDYQDVLRLPSRKRHFFILYGCCVHPTA